MYDLMDWIKKILELLPDINIQNLTSLVIETSIIAIIVYEILYWIVDTKAWTLLKGIIVIMIFSFTSMFLNLNTIMWILSKSALFIGLAIIVIFQPELRKALEKLGSQNFMKIIPIIDTNSEVDTNEKIIDEIIKATFAMGKVKTGALMVIKRNENLDDIKETGIKIDGLVSSGLLINIFEKNTPLHDGAVVIEGDRVASATCYLPLSDDMSISKDLGTRHRAALGVSEANDSLTVIVSEETGGISVADKGVLTKVKDAESLKNILETIHKKDEIDTKKQRIALNSIRKKVLNKHGKQER